MRSASSPSSPPCEVISVFCGVVYTDRFKCGGGTAVHPVRLTFPWPPLSAAEKSLS